MDSGSERKGKVVGIGFDSKLSSTEFGCCNGKKGKAVSGRI